MNRFINGEIQEEEEKKRSLVPCLNIYTFVSPVWHFLRPVVSVNVEMSIFCVGGCEKGMCSMWRVVCASELGVCVCVCVCVCGRMCVYIVCVCVSEFTLCACLHGWEEVFE